MDFGYDKHPRQQTLQKIEEASGDVTPRNVTVPNRIPQRTVEDLLPLAPALGGEEG